MKTIYVAQTAIILGALFCAGAEAQSVLAGIRPYAEAKVGLMSVDNGVMDNSLSGTIAGGAQLPPVDPGAVGGIDVPPVTLAAEGEVIRTLGGDLKGGGDWDVTMVCAYGVMIFDIVDAVYVKGRLGLLWLSVKGKPSGAASWSKTDSGVTGGIGGGFRFGANSAIEAEITGLAEDVILLSAGYKRRF